MSLKFASTAIVSNLASFGKPRARGGQLLWGGCRNGSKGHTHVVLRMTAGFILAWCQTDCMCSTKKMDALLGHAHFDILIGVSHLIVLHQICLVFITIQGGLILLSHRELRW